jgi:hypothetical protein
MTPAQRRRAAGRRAGRSRRGHDVPAADVDAALTLTGDIPEVSDDEADDYNTLHRRAAGGIQPTEE